MYDKYLLVTDRFRRNYRINPFSFPHIFWKLHFIRAQCAHGRNRITEEGFCLLCKYKLCKQEEVQAALDAISAYCYNFPTVETNYENFEQQIYLVYQIGNTIQHHQPDKSNFKQWKRGGCRVLSKLKENRASYQFEVNPSGRNENIFQY